MTVLETQGLAARHAARALAVAGTARKNAALEAAARTIEARQGEILAANAADLEAAMAAGLRPALLDRLALDEGRIAAMAGGIRATVKLPDHTGRILSEFHHANGMTIYKKQVPLGLDGPGRLALEELGEVLGRYDGDGQREALAHTRAELSRALEQAREAREKQGRMYQVLAITAGAFLVILLL